MRWRRRGSWSGGYRLLRYVRCPLSSPQSPSVIFSLYWVSSLRQFRISIGNGSVWCASSNSFWKGVRPSLSGVSANKGRSHCGFSFHSSVGLRSTTSASSPLPIISCRMILGFSSTCPLCAGHSSPSLGRSPDLLVNAFDFPSAFSGRYTIWKLNCEGNRDQRICWLLKSFVVVE